MQAASRSCSCAHMHAEPQAQTRAAGPRPTLAVEPALSSSLSRAATWHHGHAVHACCTACAAALSRQTLSGWRRLRRVARRRQPARCDGDEDWRRCPWRIRHVKHRNVDILQGAGVGDVERAAVRACRVGGPVHFVKADGTLGSSLARLCTDPAGRCDCELQGAAGTHS